MYHENTFLIMVKVYKKQGSAAFLQQKNQQKRYLPVTKQFRAKISKKICFKITGSHHILNEQNISQELFSYLTRKI